MASGMIFGMISGNNSPVQTGLLDLEDGTGLITLEDGTSGISIVYVTPVVGANYLAQETVTDDLITLEDGGFIIVT
jgi:hypothetical protein